MTDLVLMFLLSQPHRVTFVGRLLYRFAAFQILAGVIAQLLTIALRRTQPHGDYRLIADVLPNLPTWWIPESVLGMIAVTTVAAIGLAIAYGGRQVERRLA